MLLKKTNGSTMKEEILKIPWDNWQWKHNYTKSMGYSKSSPKREVHSDTGLHQKNKKTSQINNLTYHLKEWEKEEKNKT